MSDVLFYHLTQSPLEATLPDLLERSLERDWIVRVQGRTKELLEGLDRHLWTYKEEGFLPHGLAGGAHDTAQPILLTSETANTNNAQVLMLIDGAEVRVEDLTDYERVCVFFDGNDADATAQAREDWKAVKAAGLEAKYWAQEDGRWQQKA